MEWISVKDKLPKATTNYKNKLYVLLVDAKGRMSVGYRLHYDSGETMFITAKPIGEVTHWMPLPEPPK